MRLNKLKLSTKLITSFSIMIVLIAGACTLSIMKLSQITSTTDEIVNLEIKKSSLLYGLSNDVSNISVLIRNIAIDNDVNNTINYTKTIEDKMSNYKKIEKEVGTLVYTEKGKEKFKKIQINSKVAFEAFYNAIDEGSRVNTNTEDLQTLINKLEKPENDLLSSINDLENLQEDLANQKALSVKNISGNTTTYMVIILIADIVLVVLLTYLIIRSINKQIKEIKDGAFKISEGNLNFKMAASADDQIGQTVTSLNNAIGKLNESMILIKDESNKIVKSSELTNDMFSEVSGRIEQISAATEEISAGMEQSSASIQEITAMALTVKEDINNISEEANQGLDIALNIQKNHRQLITILLSQRKKQKKYIESRK